MPGPVLTQTDLPLPRFGVGKVRDTYDLGDRLLMVTTDRVSAYDCVMPNGIPGKGEVLTRLSAFWFGRTAEIIPNHLLSTDMGELPPEAQPWREQLAGRSMIVRKAKRIDFECVARGYLAGSAWSEYRASGMVCGVRLPAGLRQADELPEPIFTPAIKAESGHDENISLEEMKNRVGEDLGQALADATLAIYAAAASYALDRGIIIADTKMEFGLLDGQLILIDELLTPDSSRFWAVGEYAPGGSPPSFDKQYLRDWLDSSGWNHQPPAPTLPDDVVAGTAARYREALEWLTDEPMR
ncbi:MAG: Phosphoribosylaminoimidazole-succinocarboxamide synthase [Ktedonobacterales bacterium]|jgi:phosphoribosylaminoimidazole-succinocarboxamide synthase|nr:MAG: Phosphoribosylaminoimidazole-succinocarboxamide synthase [Ktedonobacterales bacterium]